MTTVLILIVCAAIIWAMYAWETRDKPDDGQRLRDAAMKRMLEAKERELNLAKAGLVNGARSETAAAKIAGLENELAVVQQLMVSIENASLYAPGRPERTSSQHRTDQGLEDLGSLLAEWCLDASSEKFVNAISDASGIVPETLHARLRFSLYIVNSAFVIIAANETLKEKASAAIDPFQRAFVGLAKTAFRVPAQLGDFICSEAEIGELVAKLQPPQGTDVRSLQVELSDLVAIVQSIRLMPYISLYQRGRPDDPLGKLGPVAYVFVKQLLGDRILEDAEVGARKLVAFLALAFPKILDTVPLIGSQSEHGRASRR